MKVNVRHRQKDIYIYNLLYVAALKTLSTHDGFILALIFTEDMIYIEALPVQFLCRVTKECFFFNNKLPTCYPKPFLSLPVVIHKERSFNLSCLFGVPGWLLCGSFLPTPACYG